jgi:hypothetical protein
VRVSRHAAHDLARHVADKGHRLLDIEFGDGRLIRFEPAACNRKRHLDKG